MPSATSRRANGSSARSSASSSLLTKPEHPEAAVQIRGDDQVAVEVDAPDRDAAPARTEELLRVLRGAREEAGEKAGPGGVRDVGGDDALAVPGEKSEISLQLRVVDAVGDIESL